MFSLAGEVPNVRTGAARVRARAPWESILEAMVLEEGIVRSSAVGRRGLESTG